MEITLETLIPWIPKKFNNNLEEPEEKRVVLYWRHPTPKEWGRMKRLLDPVITSKGMSGKLHMHLDYDMMIEVLVPEVKNLKVNGKEVRSGVDINSTPGLNDLKDEWCGMAMKEIESVTVKKRNRDMCVSYPGWME